MWCVEFEDWRNTVSKVVECIGFGCEVKNSQENTHARANVTSKIEFCLSDIVSKYRKLDQ